MFQKTFPLGTQSERNVFWPPLSSASRPEITPAKAGIRTPVECTTLSIIQYDVLHSVQIPFAWQEWGLQLSRLRGKLEGLEPFSRALSLAP